MRGGPLAGSGVVAVDLRPRHGERVAYMVDVAGTGSDTLAPLRDCARRRSRMRAKVFARSVFTAGTYLNSGERMDECPFGSCGCLVMASVIRV